MSKEEKLVKQWVTEFYDKYSEDGGMDEHDFESIALGFFIAKGATPHEAWELYQECIELGKF